ncbi:MAG: hypothetical protein IJU20_07740 [Clostridia bacterium]|nr:hypothetical protein [Clostridia bacterium]
MSILTRNLLFFVCLLALAGVFGFVPKIRSGVRRVALITLAFALAFEVFVANFHTFHLWFRPYEKTEILLTDPDVTLSGGYFNGDRYASYNGTVKVEIKNLGRPVGTVYAVLEHGDNGEIEGAQTVSLKADFTDETQMPAYRNNMANGTVIEGYERSSYLVLNASGKMDRLRLTFTAESDTHFELVGLTLNQGVPMQFSALRLLLLFGLILGVYLLCTSPVFRAPFGEKGRELKRILAVGTAVLLIGAFLTSGLSLLASRGIFMGFMQKNQINFELVEAFEHGQVHLLAEPSEELLGLNNPYDWEERYSKGVSYLWDHLLYDGHYYSYYGIAPVLFLFLPWHAITGNVFPTDVAVLLFGMLGILFLTLLFIEAAKLFGKRIPNGILFCTWGVMQFSTGVFYNFMSPLFYEIAQSSGFFCVCAGFYFLFRSGVVGQGKIRRVSLALSSTFLALGVLCRPTLALYCVVALFFIGYGFFKVRAGRDSSKETEPEGEQKPEGEKKPEGKRGLGPVVPYLLCAFLPFAFFGGIQMVYNLMRFGNPLDFGIQYSLTINDFTRSQYHTDFVLIGLHNFLFAFPQVGTDFPFIFSNFSRLGLGGYYYVANTNAVGLLFRSLPTWGYFGVVPAFRALDRREKRMALLLGLPLCLVAPLIIIFSIWESGYGVRYCADFAWELILGGAILFWILYSRRAKGQGKTILEYAFAGMLVLSFFVNFAMLYSYMPRTGQLTAFWAGFSSLFTFWK